jgi:hypothetical protein
LALVAAGGTLALRSGSPVAPPEPVAEVLDAGLEEVPKLEALLDFSLEEPLDAGPALEPRQQLRQAPAGAGKVNVVTTHRGEPYWAQVRVDGIDRGRTPLLIELSAGRHLVRVDRIGFRPEERQIKIASGRLAVVRIALSK